jgi:hypothetical protein
VKRIDLIRHLELLSPPIIKSCEAYCNYFGRLVTASGSALDMIAAAELEVAVALTNAPPAGR